jgi:hypothetical protein
VLNGVQQFRPTFDQQVFVGSGKVREHFGAARNGQTAWRQRTYADCQI